MRLVKLSGKLNVLISLVNPTSSTSLTTESEILTIYGTQKMQKEAVIKSAASAASLQGGCISGRLDHGLKFYIIQGACASRRLLR